MTLETHLAESAARVCQQIKADLAEMADEYRELRKAQERLREVEEIRSRLIRAYDELAFWIPRDDEDASL